MAGGNGILSVLGSPGLAMGAGASSPQAAMAGPIGVTNSEGTTANLGHIQVAVGALMLISLAVLIGMNKAGFRFSVTVG